MLPIYIVFAVHPSEVLIQLDKRRQQTTQATDTSLQVSAREQFMKSSNTISQFPLSSSRRLGIPFIQSLERDE